MNLVMLFEEDFVAPDRVVLRDRRLAHICRVHRAMVRDELRVGLLQGAVGSARIEQLSEHQATLVVTLLEAPPVPLPVTLVMALPRPKMLRRCLQMVAEMGIKRLYLINSVRVEKSFWLSPLLQPQKIREHLVLGLEQSRDTVLPEVHLRSRFKPFVEDELPGLIDGGTGLLAHPSAAALEHPWLPLTGESLLCIGPEGGFVSYEVDKIAYAGCRLISLGARIYRVETALPLLIGRLFV